MTLRAILTWPDDRLTARCAPVEGITDEVHLLAADMLETMYAAPGRGLAAPQVGELLRLFVMDATWKEGTPDPLVCINPEIVSAGTDAQTHAEGCLSIPGVEAQVSRPKTIRLAWTDLAGARYEADLSGFAALCAQHEFDHLDGILTLDRIDAAQRAEVLAAYQKGTP